MLHIILISLVLMLFVLPCFSGSKLKLKGGFIFTLPALAIGGLLATGAAAAAKAAAAGATLAAAGIVTGAATKVGGRIVDGA